MSGNFVRNALGAAALALTVGAATQAVAQAQEPLKVGFVYVSPIGEAGWSWQQEVGRRQMMDALGDKVVSQYVEDVPEGADAERVIRDLAQQGNKLIFTTSFGYMNPTLKVAKQFPDVTFVHSTGYKMADNVGVTNSRFYEARYLAGIVAGKMTESNIIGYVGAFPIPEVLQGINAFTRGIRSVNPNAEVRVIWANSWYDPGKERDAALALLGQGADIITHHTDSTATVQVAEEKGKYAVAYHSDMSRFAPKAQLVAVTHHWGDYFTETARQVIEGTWKPTMTWGGLKEGMARVEGFGPAVPEDVRALVEEKKQQIIEGKLTPFDAPVKDNTGKVVLESGSLDDDALTRMNYYVEGVAGKLPTR
ncbi:MAG TPA: BMP family ABC transporter substrate-binding protein [Burkholderiaceae bacterium]|nr:BMP family ABC transporter substrate-binding protein [Burkholderiaceae bacterium]